MDTNNVSNQLVRIINSAFKKVFLGVWTIIFTSTFIYCLHYFKFSYNKHIWIYLNVPTINTNTGLFEFYSEHVTFLFLVLASLVVLNILCFYGACFTIAKLKNKEHGTKNFLKLWLSVIAVFLPFIFILQIIFVNYSILITLSIFIVITLACAYLLYKDDKPIQKSDPLFENFLLTCSILYLIFIFGFGNISMIALIAKDQGIREGKKIKNIILSDSYLTTGKHAKLQSSGENIFLIQNPPNAIGLKKSDNGIVLLFLDKDETKTHNDTRTSNKTSFSQNSEI